jgi:hypothetical protein
MRKLALIFFLFLFAAFASAQPLHKLCALPQIVNESSGMVVVNENRLWTVNDSGGEVALYLCDTSGNLVRTVKVLGAWNRDWEELTQDDDGNLYIGNIGNNANDSKDLCIFKIANPYTSAADSVQAQVIHFSYEDQKLFPPAESAKNFDCEAMLWWKGSLYLFSKNRTFPFDGKTYLYQLPDTAGSYVAKKVGEFNTNGKSMFNNWITGAAMSPDKTKLALLSSNKMWLFSAFEGDHFFAGKSKRIKFRYPTQKEAISFVNNTKVYISDERFKKTGGKLYVLHLK